MNKMQELYNKEIAPALLKSFGFKNVMQVPRLDKIVVNIGLGEAMDNPKALEAAVADLALVTGQKPIQTKARKSIANFKLREGRLIGTKVTLRGPRMWAFFDRLVNIALPRVRDFRGISPNSFDGRGNYTLGLKDQLVFPEIEYDKIDKLRGMEVTIVTTAQNDDEARALLRLLGMPFSGKKEA
jgi:large subunit ribosomal protein L5